MGNNWDFDHTDIKLLDGLKSILPDRVFDAHAHIYRLADISPVNKEFFSNSPEIVDINIWREYVSKLATGSQLIGGLIIGFPTTFDDINVTNDYVMAQIDSTPDCRGLALISPESPMDKIAEYLNHPRIVGLKPYYFYSKETSSSQASLSSFLPEWAWELADQKSSIITLHLTKDRALSDPDNQREIVEKCSKYPNVKLILAHCARGFHAPNTINGIDAIRGLQNIWFDTSAICESAAISTILEEFGPRKLLWGTDFPVSHIKGRCVTIGQDFAWINPDRADSHAAAPQCRSTFVGIESVRSLKEAGDIFGLNETDYQYIFCQNALELLNMEKQADTRTSDLYVHAKTRIPGGTQLLTKRPEMMAPNQWPAYFSEARGCEVWDLDGRHYYDMSFSGIESCLLGYRDPDVTRAVKRCINLGSMSTLNPPEEVELSDLLCEIHPWANQVRLTRSGGEAATVAVRIARATTDRSIIAVCGYHGWHDWYLAANLGESDSLRGHLLPGLDPYGVPTELRGTTVTFGAGNREEFQSVIDRYGDRIAAVVMEPCRHHDPEPGFLEFVRNETHKHGGLLIFDEITIGWRLHFGGAHLKFGVNPDIAIFAKALGNGHPIGAVIGSDEAMSGAHSSFISSTYWTERVGPVAALATIRKMQKVDVPAHVAKIGALVTASWRKHADSHSVPISIEGDYPCLAHFVFKHENANELKTLYVQMMLERGFLGGLIIYPNMAHTEDIVSLYDKAIDEVFREIGKAISKGDVSQRLKGPVAHTGFKRLN